MSKIEFSRDEKDILVQKLKTYFAQELDHEIGQFECEFFLDFIAGEIGAFYYNRGLSDAELIVADRFEEIKDALYAAEMPLKLHNR